MSVRNDYSFQRIINLYEFKFPQDDRYPYDTIENKEKEYDKSSYVFCIFGKLMIIGRYQVNDPFDPSVDSFSNQDQDHRTEQDQLAENSNIYKDKYYAHQYEGEELNPE